MVHFLKLKCSHLHGLTGGQIGIGGETGEGKMEIGKGEMWKWEMGNGSSRRINGYGRRNRRRENGNR
jgi:hypothetical protein